MPRKDDEREGVEMERRALDGTMREKGSGVLDVRCWRAKQGKRDRSPYEASSCLVPQECIRRLCSGR